MTEHYCPSCYRTLPSEHAICFSCTGRTSSSAPSRLPLILGFAGVPLLLMGMFGFSLDLCLAGGIVSAIGVLAHVVLALR